MTEKLVAQTACDILRMYGERTEARLRDLVEHFLRSYPALERERTHELALTLAKTRGTL